MTTDPGRGQEGVAVRDRAVDDRQIDAIEFIGIGFRPTSPLAFKYESWSMYGVWLQIFTSYGSIWFSRKSANILSRTPSGSFAIKHSSPAQSVTRLVLFITIPWLATGRSPIKISPWPLLVQNAISL